MAERYSNNQQKRPKSGQRPSRQELERRRAARERERRQKQRIRIVTLVIAIVVVLAIVIIIAVSCSNKKNTQPSGSSATQPSGTESPTDNPSGGTAKDEIPTEYVEATVSHDDIAITDENPIQGTDGSCSIRVNTALNAVTVYDADGKALRVMACSTGRRDGHETPEGTFTLGEWIILPANEWCYMADGTEGLYAYRIIDNINNDIMFHSVPYYETDHGTLEYEEYNKLGDYASMGCIRMCLSDCRWLGELCATGTEVVIYYDEDETLPMEKPLSYKIPTEIEEVRGWDPTDPASDNPWHKYTITLEVPNSIEVEKGADYAQDPIIAAAKATDNYGNDLNAYISYDGTYDSETEGVYKVEVSCDVGPSHAVKEVYVIVE